MKPKDYDKVGTLIAEAQRELFGWVPYQEYARMFPDETRERLRSRIRLGTWKAGVHYTRGSERDLWIHLRNVKAWLEQRPPEKAPFGR